jgi:hypothetical protein
MANVGLLPLQLSTDRFGNDFLDLHGPLHGGYRIALHSPHLGWGPVPYPAVADTPSVLSPRSYHLLPTSSAFHLPSHDRSATHLNRGWRWYCGQLPLPHYKRRVWHERGARMIPELTQITPGSQQAASSGKKCIFPVRFHMYAHAHPTKPDVRLLRSS